MSERITAANLDEVIKRNEVIEEQMKQSASLIWSKYNPMQINSPIQLALQILRPCDEGNQYYEWWNFR